MTIGDFLKQSTERLRTAGVESPRLDILVLLEDALQQDRARLLAHMDAKIAQETEVDLNKKIMQRTKDVPLAYIRGIANFYGRTFNVTPSVLVPRPESEAFIDLLKTTAPQLKEPRIADIGTGSGCIGVTAGLEIPEAKVDLYDIDPLALQIAKQNAKAHKLRLQTYNEDLLMQASDRAYDVILANLPYVPVDFPTNAAVRHEPAIAIFSGYDGLEAYRQFWQQIASLHTQPKYILTEALTSQHAELQTTATFNGYSLNASQGLVQMFIKD